ncbi:MAG TPA: hypothetical protein VF503_10270 [Sphingobium sp.]|uniref:bestrophin-like domain n=1 Tax=Sphingobium sp. TaxID=1912891 RepID=UPI002ECFB0EC
MMQDGFFNSAPLWLIVPCIFGALVLVAWIGTIVRGHLRPDPHDDASEGYLLSAALALLGLLIGFTFSMALNRYDTRREMLVQEANSIGTAWLRAGLAEGEPGEALRRSMHDYGVIRLDLARSPNPDAVEDNTGKTQVQLWQRVRTAIATMQPPLAATLVTATTEMFDAASSRRWEREARIPALVLDILIVSALISAGIVGYVLGGSGRRHALVTGLLFALLSLAITLILDLDRPWTGLVTISQVPMESAVAAMH